MTIHEASQQLRFQLFHQYDEREAGNITDLVMENITGWKRIDRVVNKTASLSAAQQALLQSYTNALLNNTPLQYVLQEAWFYGLRLFVDENVLIPRPETEELVDWLVKEYRQGPGDRQALPGLATHILDMGTGSGCIALAIKKCLPAAFVHACDISLAAIELAKKNAAALQLDINFHLLDILTASPGLLPVFDIIISNPPYIPQKDKDDMAPNVLQYEPMLALFVEDNDPLLFYKAIANFAQPGLAKNGLIYMEIHEDMADAVVDLFKHYGYSGIEIKKDLQGKDRMVKVSVGKETGRDPVRGLPTKSA
ncbi:MAG: peptide chain release factor N(5)-glutamine methyltransferase [Bacteroidota bacterium]